VQENKFVKNLVSKMTLEQKVGAVLTLGFAGNVIRPHIYEYIEKYHCGGFRLSPNSRTFGSYVDPETGHVVVKLGNIDGYKKGVEPPYVTGAQYKEVLDKLQKCAMNRRLGIPLHFSTDQEGGSSAAIRTGGYQLFPKPMGLRATGDSKLAYEVARAIARQMKSAGINWLHSPVLDINSNPDNPSINTRAYSDRVEEVIEYARQTCIGFKEGKLIAAAKHFPGDGGSGRDGHYGITVVHFDKETILNREIQPYRVLIKEGLLPSIMSCHVLYPALDEEYVGTLSKRILTGILREELGFEGVITTDSMTMGAIAVKYSVPVACAMSLAAGADLVLMKAENELVDQTFNTILRYVEEGKLPEKELDQKVYRVLKMKYDYGLFTNGNLYHETPEEVAKDEKITLLSKIVAQKSVLVARNRSNLLPLPENEKILVIEQMNTGANDAYWHHGILYENCLKYNKKVSYLETSYSYDEEDKERIKKAVSQNDTIVITNFYKRGTKSNTRFVEEILKDKSKKFVLIANTPYKLNIPDEADNVIVSFATTPCNMEVVAGVLFGKIQPEGEWPVQYWPGD